MRNTTVVLRAFLVIANIIIDRDACFFNEQVAPANEMAYEFLLEAACWMWILNLFESMNQVKHD